MQIVLACNAGMSTSMLVEAMKKSAVQKGIEVEINAMPQAQVQDYLAANGNVKIVVLGPQVKFLLEATKKIAEPYNIPVDVVDMLDYGMMDGEKVLTKALAVING